MNRFSQRAFLALAVCAALGGTAHAEGDTSKPSDSSVGGVLRDIGHVVHKGAVEAGHAARDTTKEVGHATKKAATAVGHTTRKIAKDVRDDVKDAAASDK